MIARIWHSLVPREKADAYVHFLRGRAIPDYHRVPGNRGAYVLCAQDASGHARVMTLSFWDSIDAIVAFAGKDYTRAKYYREDEAICWSFRRKSSTSTFANRK